MSKYSKFSREDLIKIIEKLSHDKAFDIYTRTGLEIEMEGEYNCIFIDFNNVHELNHTIGYNKVNEKIQNILYSVADYCILVGRFFSGDEIVILTKLEDLEILIEILKREAKINNMSFKYKTFYHIINLDEINI